MPKKSKVTTKAILQAREDYRLAARAMWEAGAKFGGRNPKLELRAFDAGWEVAMTAADKYPLRKRS